MSERDSSYVPLGSACIALGCGAAWIASDYPYGSVTAMGPGFIPTVVAGLLILLGVITLILGGRDVEPVPSNDGAPAASPWTVLRAMVCVLGAIVLFAVAIKPLGLGVTLFLVVIVAGLAPPDARPLPLAGLAALLSAAACVLFVVLLGLQIDILPRWR